MRIIRSRTTRASALLTAASLLALTGALAAPAGTLAASTSLPAQRGTAPRPGPAVLYEPLAQAPQLENAPGSVWRAPPILTSGASAYRSGEFLYQGYVYDDHGAKLTPDPNNPMTAGGGGDPFSAPDGTYTYPTGPGYHENAANLIELRVQPLISATAFPITLNTLEDPNLIATAIAIGGSEGTTHPFPFGANVSAPAQDFLTIHGETAALTDAITRAQGPRAERQRRPRAAPDHRAGARRRVESRLLHGAPRRGRGAVGRSQQQVPAPARYGERDGTGRRGSNAV